MIKKYRANHYSGKIIAVEVLRETDGSVFITSGLGVELRRSKYAEYESYHGSFEDARQALRGRLMSDLADAERRVNTIKSRIAALDEQKERGENHETQ